jgi:hypothetical protein
VSLALEIVPILEVEVSLHGIAKRALHPEPVWEAAFEAQEARQGYPFRGRQLVRTGRLRDSLTQPGADGAIREVHVPPRAAQEQPRRVCSLTELAWNGTVHVVRWLLWQLGPKGGYR